LVSAGLNAAGAGAAWRVSTGWFEIAAFAKVLEDTRVAAY
jgi:hypothetical protein